MARESLVSDIPAGDGKNDNIFLQCTLYIESGENVINTSRYYLIHSHFPQSMGRLSVREIIFIGDSALGESISALNPECQL
jgi:hypothetical protein